jgi:magnesium-transporting ATPase (P-type)
VALVIFLSSINDYAHEKSFQIIKGKPEVKLVRVYRGGRLYLLNPEEIMVGDIVEIMGGDQVNVDGVLISC